MSITREIRGYADSALEQGKHVVGQAQAQINDVTEQANELVGKLALTAKDRVVGLTGKLTGTATDAVQDLRSQAEQAMNLAALKTAVEPYLAHVRHYGTSVTDRAEGIFDSVRNDKRVVLVVATAESLTGVVIETVNKRVVRPVGSLAGRGTKPAVHIATPPIPTTATRPAATRPAAAPRKNTAPKTTAAKTTAAKTTAPKTTAAKSTAKSTAARNTARKAPGTYPAPAK